MTFHRTMLLAIGLLLASGTVAAAQDLVAEVETWSGAVLRIERPILETFYTIIPAPLLGRTGVAVAEGGSAPAAAAGGPGSTAVNVTLGKSLQETPVGAGPAPIQGRRSQPYVTFMRDGVETRVPFERIAAMMVERRRVTGPVWPSYADPIVQSLATATLIDGAVIDATPVSFGNAVLRGMAPQGVIELPLGEIRTLKITR